MVADTSIFRADADMNPIAWDRVAAYLARFGHTLDPNFPPRQFSGGLGNWNFLVKVDARFYVLRRPPAGALPIGANDMAREHRILSHLNKVFPLAPASLLFCDDPLIIGAPFLLLEYREGIIIRDRLAENVAAGVQQRRGLAMTTLNVLAQLHGVDPHAIGLGTLGKPDGMVSRQALNWTRRAQQAYDGELPRALVEVATWLAQPAPAPQKVCLLHSDFKIDNIIFDRPTLAPVALIDWDMGTLGDPLLDVATLLSYWTERDDPPVMHELKQMPTALDGFPSRDEVLHLYAEKTGCDISDFKYYRILAMFKLCIVFRQLYAKHLRGDPVPAAYASFGGLSDGLAEFTHHTLQSKQL